MVTWNELDFMVDDAVFVDRDFAIKMASFLKPELYSKVRPRESSTRLPAFPLENESPLIRFGRVDSSRFIHRYCAASR